MVAIDAAARTAATKRGNGDDRPPPWFVAHPKEGEQP
jgi:hypothetical protein